MRRRVLLLAFALAPAGGAAAACATLGSPPGGDQALPSANVGPFRKLTKIEEPTTPFVFSGLGYDVGEPSALAVDPKDPSSTNVYLYLVAITPSPSGTSATRTIIRSRADDARSFYGTSLDSHSPPDVPPVVLAATLPWEGTDVAGPSVLRVGSEYYLYYAAKGGIGLARSADGLTFEKEPAPVLAIDETVAWETTAPSAPSVAVRPDGTFEMMYAAGLSIGEATSHDGITFTRVDADPGTPAIDPVLSPVGGVGQTPDGSVGPIDTGQVGDPCVLADTTPAGRLVVRVLYTGYDGPPTDASRGSAIGLAARYGTTGRLVRQPLPVFAIGMHEAAPTYFRWSGGEMLYTQALPTQLFGTPAQQIAAAIAPPTLTLAAPTTFASSP